MSFGRLALLLLAACLALASPAPAATVVSFAGSGSSSHPVSAIATFTLGDGTLTVELANTTAHSYDAGQLLTGLDFALSDINQASITAAVVDGLAIADDGGASPQGSANLLAAGNHGSPTWEVTGGVGQFNGDFRLDFHPDSKYALVGPAEASGEYALGNGSIKGNPGHNPYGAGTATFTLAIPELSPNSTVTGVQALFGTNLDTSVLLTTLHVPVPASLWTGLGMLVALGALYVRRRRTARGE